MRRHRFGLLLAGLAITPFSAFVACTGEDPPASANDAGGTGSEAAASDAASGDDRDELPDSGSDGDAAPAPYDVRSLKGLRLWLESSRELVKAPGGSGFESWADQSRRWDGGVNEGSPDGGRFYAMPQNVNPPSIEPNGFGGHPTVAFTDGNGYLRIDNNDDLQTGLGDFMIVEVAKVASGGGTLWSLSSGASAGTAWIFSPNKFCFSFGQFEDAGCTGTGPAPSTSPHVFVTQRKDDVFSVRVDGTVIGSVNRTASPPDLFVSKFARDYAFIGAGLTMQLSEVIFIYGPTSDVERDTLERHLKEKFSIP